MQYNALHEFASSQNASNTFRALCMRLPAHFASTGRCLPTLCPTERYFSKINLPTLEVE